MSDLKAKEYKQFEEIKHIRGDGSEYWSARELAIALDYTKWENFSKVIGRAMIACENSGHSVVGDFPEVRKIVEAGATSKPKKDYELSRYACYLIVQNSDPRKEVVALGQTYFAIQTRKAELIEQRLLEIERVRARTKLQETEKHLSGVLYEHGVDSKGFAMIRSKGDQALFHLDTSQMKRKLGVPANRPVADFLPTISIKAKDFAAEMTHVNVQQKALYGESEISREHVDNNAAVRQMMIERGIVPENLPPAEDVKKVERRLAAEKKKALSNKTK